MKLYSFLLLVIFNNTTSVNSQSVTELVNGMKNEIYTSQYIGDNIEHVTLQWQFYESLKSIASIEELISLTNHENPVIRCYSFQALWENKHPIVFNIFKNHLTDFEPFSAMIGCISYQKTVNEFMLELIGKRNYYLNTQFQIAFQRDNIREQKMTFEEASLHFENIANEAMLYSKYLPDQFIIKLARIIEPKPEYYHRIKHLFLNSKQRGSNYVRGQTEELLILLSNYQNPIDTKFIIPYLEAKNVHTLNYGILAVKKFRSPIFFGYLEKIKERFAAYKFNTVPHFYPYLFDYYEAIALYQNKEAKEIFSFILNSTTEEEDLLLHKQHIWLAISNINTPVADEIRASLNLLEKDKAEILKLKDRRAN